jgi:hypothetical protein
LTSRYFAGVVYQSFKLQNYIVGGMIFLERDKMPKRERWGRERESERERELCVQLSTCPTYVTQVERGL